MSVNIKTVVKGAAASILFAVAVLFILSLLEHLTGISPSVINIGSYAAVILGMLLGAVIIARAADCRRLLHVLLAALIYALALLALAMILNGGICFTAHTAAVTAGIFGAAMLGCIIGNK